MRLPRLIAGFVLVSLLVPSTTKAALSKAAGGSGYSGTLSGTPAVRQQQLICDPSEPVRGSTSVLYEADKVSLRAFSYGPGYGPLDGLTGVVEVNAGGQPTLQNIQSFLDSPQGPETGYVQVFFSLTGAAGQITPTGQLYDEDPGPGLPGEGVDTHQFTFLERSPVPGAVTPQGVFPVVVATYHIYADEGNRPSGNRRDFLEGRDDAGNPVIVGPPDLVGATVTSPEPSALSLAALGGLGLLARRRTRRPRR